MRTEPVMPQHGAAHLRLVNVDSYNVELREDGAFVGDRANKQAFRGRLDAWRERLGAVLSDPLGEGSAVMHAQDLEQVLLHGEAEAAGVVLTATEEFAGDLADVCRHFLALPSWQGTERIIVGGGFRASRVGELAIGRAGVLLQAAGYRVTLRPIRPDPEQAGMLGAMYLLPPDALAEADAFLAVDIGGTNLRAGLVGFEVRGGERMPVLLHAERWRHAGERPTRDSVVHRLAAMLRALAALAESRRCRLAPDIGIGCPGVIRADGAIERGGQNLPGNWESPDFNLPRDLEPMLPRIAGQPARLVMHNDAVVQGLSEAPAMRDIPHWGVLTIGTGLGNARFTTAAFRP